MKTVVYRNVQYSAVTGKFVPFCKLEQNLVGIVSQIACKTNNNKKARTVLYFLLKLHIFLLTSDIKIK